MSPEEKLRNALSIALEQRNAALNTQIDMNIRIIELQEENHKLNEELSKFRENVPLKP